MLPKFLKILPEDNSSIQIRYESCKYFENPWHFHPELELNLLLQSTGTRFVGDSILSFKENDLVLLGPNVPHFWKNDQVYFEHRSENNAEAIVIRFQELFISKDQYDLPELRQVKRLFENSKRGLLIQGDGKKRVIASIKKMVNYNGLERLIIFLGILNAIVNTCDYKFLSSEGFMTSLSPKNEKRMNDVYNFITNNFKQKITLNDIADKANMNPSAFSRYFTQCTGRSVTTFLQEVRLGYSCKLLIDSEKNISDIMYESGFQNQAHFNKLFFNKMRMTPAKYRLKHNS